MRRLCNEKEGKIIIMKRILCLLGLAGVFATPVMAANIPYVTNIPYREYKKEIKLEKIATDTFKNDILTIEKNKYQFKYIPKLGYGYEYCITNNTDKDIIIKGIKAVDFYNEDISDKSNKPLKNIMKSSTTTGKIYIPLYGLYYATRCDLEKNSFLRDFPKNKAIKAGKSLKILASATEEQKNPVAEFVLLINGEETSVSF